MISSFKEVSLSGPKRLLTLESGVEDVRKAFFEGNHKRKIMTKARALATQPHQFVLRFSVYRKYSSLIFSY